MGTAGRTPADGVASTPGTPGIAFVLLHWNGTSDTLECLQSLLAIDYPDFRVIVVDNGSEEALRLPSTLQVRKVELIRNEDNLGFGGGMNTGLHRALEAHADVVVCLNNDTLLDQRFLLELSRLHRTYPHIAAFAPKELDFNRPGRIVFAGGEVGLIRNVIHGNGRTDSESPEDERETHMLSGACMILRAETLTGVGFLEPRYFFGFEDREYALRIETAGGRILFSPRLRVWHKRAHSTATRFNSMRAYFQTRNWLMYGVRNFSVPSRWCLALYLIMIYFPYTLLYSVLNLNVNLFAWSLRGVSWHINPSMLPSDDDLVTQLAYKP